MDATGTDRTPMSYGLPEAPTGTAPVRSEAGPGKLAARGFSAEPVRLGFDRPFQLRGGTQLAPDGLTLNLLLDWTPDIMRRVVDSCREQWLAGRDWFRMRPTALSGGRGMGRTHIARSVARSAGVPFASFDIGPFGPGRDLGVSSPRPDIAVPPRPVMAMAASGCANPIILVTGIDDALPETSEALASMIAGESAPRWVDEGLAAVVDLGDITWLLETADAEALPPSFPASLDVVELSRPEGARSSLLGLSLFAEVTADLQMPRLGLETVADHIADYARSYSHASVMELHRVTLDVIAEFERHRER